jgi:hypothetical protein
LFPTRAQCVIFPKTVYFEVARVTSVTSVTSVTKVTSITSFAVNVNGQKGGGNDTLNWAGVSEV